MLRPPCLPPALQLGYGTSDSNSNAAPRMVEAMKGKRVVAAAAAKRHTLVLTAGGEVYTWGHRGVSPRRVQLAVSAVAGCLRLVQLSNGAQQCVMVLSGWPRPERDDHCCSFTGCARCCVSGWRPHLLPPRPQ